MLVRIDAMGQDDLGHLRAHIHRLADVAVHLKVLEGVLGDSAPHAGLAVFGHDVTARDLDLGAFTLTIATGDLYHGMAHVRGVVEGHRLGVKVQVAQHTTEPRRQIDGEFGVGKSPLVKSSLVQDHRQSLDVVLVRRVGFHELQPALHQVLHREVGARPQKRARPGFGSCSGGADPPVGSACCTRCAATGAGRAPLPRSRPGTTSPAGEFKNGQACSRKTGRAARCFPVCHASPTLQSHARR